MRILLGTEVYEYFSCPILIFLLFGQSSTGFNPSNLTNNYCPDKNANMVLLPTPVSPITITACSALGSLGILAIPFFIIVLSLGRSSGFSILMTDFYSIFLNYNYYDYYYCLQKKNTNHLNSLN